MRRVAELGSLGVMRILLIIGAAYCLAISIREILVTVTYDVHLEPFSTLYMIGGFIPIILIAPRSTTPKKRFLFRLTGIIELYVIAAFHLHLFTVRY
jgi:hypothetical protein